MPRYKIRAEGAKGSAYTPTAETEAEMVGKVVRAIHDLIHVCQEKEITVEILTIERRA